MRGDIQDAKRVLADLLTSELPDALAAVDAEKDDGTETPIPTQIFTGEKVNVSTLGLPVGEIVGIKTVYSTEDAFDKRCVHEVHVWWTDAGDDELVITRTVERLVRATRDVLWPEDEAPISLPGIHSGPVQIVSEDYTHLAPHINKTGFVKGSWSVLLIPTFTV